MFWNKKIKKTYSYDDVTLIPQYSDLQSRSDAKPYMKEYYLPIIGSCMDTLGKDIMETLIYNNVPFIAHRSFSDAFKQFNYFIPGGVINADLYLYYKNLWFAVGSVMKYQKWIDYLIDQGVRHFCVDMAHGDSKTCIDTIKYLKERMKSCKDISRLNQLPHIIAGNVATKEGFQRLQKAGADGIRVGIGSGSICFAPTTKVWYISSSNKMYQKEIQHIKIGDKVLTGTGKVRQVINIFTYEYEGEMYKMNDILVTPNHKFYIYNKQNHEKIYLPIKDFDDKNMAFINAEGKTISKNIDLEEYKGNVFNIEVDDEHTYCVGNDCLAVSNCSTSTSTGMGVPILTNIIDCAKIKKETWLIADGGIKYTGDIAKAIYFGADFCMIGRMLAATDKACGDCYNINKQKIITQDFKFNPNEPCFKRPIYSFEYDKMYKLAEQFDWLTKDENSTRKNLVKHNLVAYKGYHGMASREARRGVMKYASPEGVSGIINYSCSTDQFIQDTFLRLQASLSYAGARNWQEFRKKCQVCYRSNAGIIAADTHLDFTWDK